MLQNFDHIYIFFEKIQKLYEGIKFQIKLEKQETSQLCLLISLLVVCQYSQLQFIMVLENVCLQFQVYSQIQFTAKSYKLIYASKVFGLKVAISIQKYCGRIFLGIFGVIQKVRSLETLNFNPTPIPCSFLFVLHVPRQRTFALVSYQPSFKKRFREVYEFPNKKLGSEEKRINFFVNST